MLTLKKERETPFFQCLVTTLEKLHIQLPERPRLVLSTSMKTESSAAQGSSGFGVNQTSWKALLERMAGPHPQSI